MRPRAEHASVPLLHAQRVDGVSQRPGRAPAHAFPCPPIFPLTPILAFSFFFPPLQAASNLALAAGLAAALASASPALAADAMSPPPAAEATAAARPSMAFPAATAPPVKAAGEYALPEGAQWRYSEFINAVNAGKVERVRFSKDGSQLQVSEGGGRGEEGGRVAGERKARCEEREASALRLGVGRPPPSRRPWRGPWHRAPQHTRALRVCTGAPPIGARPGLPEGRGGCAPGRCGRAGKRTSERGRRGRA